MFDADALERKLSRPANDAKPAPSSPAAVPSLAEHVRD